MSETCAWTIQIGDEVVADKFHLVVNDEKALPDGFRNGDAVMLLGEDDRVLPAINCMDRGIPTTSSAASTIKWMWFDVTQ